MSIATEFTLEFVGIRKIQAPRGSRPESAQEEPAEPYVVPVFRSPTGLHFSLKPDGNGGLSPTFLESSRHHEIEPPSPSGSGGSGPDAMSFMKSVSTGSPFIPPIPAGEHASGLQSLLGSALPGLLGSGLAAIVANAAGASGDGDHGAGILDEAGAILNFHDPAKPGTTDGLDGLLQKVLNPSSIVGAVTQMGASQITSILGNVLGGSNSVGGVLASTLGGPIMNALASQVGGLLSGGLGSLLSGGSAQALQSQAMGIVDCFPTSTPTGTPGSATTSPLEQLKALFEGAKSTASIPVSFGTGAPGPGSVLVGPLPIARVMDDAVIPDPPDTGPIFEGNPTILANGRWVAGLGMHAVGLVTGAIAELGPQSTNPTILMSSATTSIKTKVGGGSGPAASGSAGTAGSGSAGSGATSGKGGSGGAGDGGSGNDQGKGGTSTGGGPKPEQGATGSGTGGGSGSGQTTEPGPSEGSTGQGGGQGTTGGGSSGGGGPIRPGGAGDTTTGQGTTGGGSNGQGTTGGGSAGQGSTGGGVNGGTGSSGSGAGEGKDKGGGFEPGYDDATSSALDKGGEKGGEVEKEAFEKAKEDAVKEFESRHEDALEAERRAAEAEAHAAELRHAAEGEAHGAQTSAEQYDAIKKAQAAEAAEGHAADLRNAAGRAREGAEEALAKVGRISPAAAAKVWKMLQNGGRFIDWASKAKDLYEGYHKIHDAAMKGDMKGAYKEAGKMGGGILGGTAGADLAVLGAAALLADAAICTASAPVCIVIIAGAAAAGGLAGSGLGKIIGEAGGEIAADAAGVPGSAPPSSSSSSSSSSAPPKGGLPSQPPIFCFDPSTIVQTPSGPRSIADLQLGDLVICGDRDGNRVERAVVGTAEGLVSGLIEIEAGDLPIRTTPGHHWYVEGRGWTAAGELAIGDRLRLGDGSHASVDALKRIDGAVIVHNIEVEEYHNYLVGTTGFLVHNMEMQGPGGRRPTKK